MKRFISKWSPSTSLKLFLLYLELDRSVRGIYFRCVGEEDDAMVSIENSFIHDSEDARIV